MIDEDEVIFSTSHLLEKAKRRFGDTKEYYKKARDINLPISEVNRKLSV